MGKASSVFLTRVCEPETNSLLAVGQLRVSDSFLCYQRKQANRLFISSSSQWRVYERIKARIRVVERTDVLKTCIFNDARPPWIFNTSLGSHLPFLSGLAKWHLFTNSPLYEEFMEGNITQNQLHLFYLCLLSL